MNDAPPPPVVEGRLPASFPDDFPLYPDLSIGRSSPLGGRYITEARSEDSAEQIIEFYERELAAGRWELLDKHTSEDPESTTLRFTAPGLSIDGRVLVTEVEGETVVGIAMPIEAGEGD